MTRGGEPTPTCPTCGQADQVEDSVEPEKWDGYCYRCMAPFVGPFVGLQRFDRRRASDA